MGDTRNSRTEAANVGPLVFVVDGDAAVRDSLAWLLRSMRIDVRVFATAIEFLSNCDSSRPACALVDSRLPGFSGAELQRKLNARGIRIPTILMTSNGDWALVERPGKAGAFDCLHKPFTDEALLAALCRCLKIET